MKAPITSAQAMLHPTVVETINALGTIADEHRALTEMLVRELRLGPLPEYAHEFSPRWFGDCGGFTGAQMRLYALQERAAERARWVEAVMTELDGNGQAHAIVACASRS